MIIIFNLSRVLYIAQKWNAVILIDEADVFLETRYTRNLQINAIVCVFLRLIEKYSGIMFLTTNRRTEIDHAFQSRISLTLEYNKLLDSERLIVWKNLCSLAKITP
jgi:SpoVK/Ycf46/Vps4 family AAA+-type ATPase